MTRPRRKAGVLQRELADGEAVLLGADGQQAVVLNAMGGVVWDLCDGERSTEEMVTVIVEALPGTDIELVRRDLAALLEQLERAGFVEAGEAGG